MGHIHGPRVFVSSGNWAKRDLMLSAPSEPLDPGAFSSLPILPPTMGSWGEVFVATGRDRRLLSIFHGVLRTKEIGKETERPCYCVSYLSSAGAWLSYLPNTEIGSRPKVCIILTADNLAAATAGSFLASSIHTVVDSLPHHVPNRAVYRTPSPDMYLHALMIGISPSPEFVWMMGIAFSPAGSPNRPGLLFTPRDQTKG